MDFSTINRRRRLTTAREIYDGYHFEELAKRLHRDINSVNLRCLIINKYDTTTNFPEVRLRLIVLSYSRDYRAINTALTFIWRLIAL